MKRSQRQTQTTSPGPAPAGSATKSRATKSRRGFTLVELLVVISIIGILVGLLAVAIGPVLRTVYDGAVTTEMKQIELAVESFNNKYGFYPPSFSGVVSTSDQLLPYLNKISPNHRELSPMPGNPGVTRLEHWWNEIGSNLDSRSSLVFWLSSVCSNKQFPLTGSVDLRSDPADPPLLPAAFGGSQVVSGTGGSKQEQRLADGVDIPRDSFFDFRAGQLADRGLDFVNATQNSINLPAGIRIYNTPYGEESDNRGNAYLYRNSQTYRVRSPQGRPSVYHVDPDLDLTTANEVFVNPNTFQLFTFGQDGLAADRALNYIPDPNIAGDIDAVASNQDNLTNFANGRLETFDWRANLGL